MTCLAMARLIYFRDWGTQRFRTLLMGASKKRYAKKAMKKARKM